MKKQNSVWKNIFANDTIDKGLISKIWNSSWNLITQTTKTNNTIKKRKEDLNSYFSKKKKKEQKNTDGQIHMKRRCPTSLIVTEMQINTTMRYHLTLVRMAIIKSLQTTSAGEGVEKKDPFYTIGGM